MISQAFNKYPSVDTVPLKRVKKRKPSVRYGLKNLGLSVGSNTWLFCWGPEDPRRPGRTGAPGSASDSPSADTAESVPAPSGAESVPEWTSVQVRLHRRRCRHSPDTWSRDCRHSSLFFA